VLIDSPVSAATFCIDPDFEISWNTSSQRRLSVFCIGSPPLRSAYAIHRIAPLHPKKSKLGFTFAARVNLFYSEISSRIWFAVQKSKP
jgi:hypothetical protein